MPVPASELAARLAARLCHDFANPAGGIQSGLDFLDDPASPIRIKIIHRGRPTPIDAAFWQQRLDAAMAVRGELIAGGHSTGYRCINGENDGFPGLVLDRYADTLVLKLYSPAWLAHLATLLPVID